MKQYLVYKTSPYITLQYFTLHLTETLAKSKKLSSITLDDFKFPDTFAMVLKWMYSQGLSQSSREHDGTSIAELCRLWLLTYRLRI